MAKTDAQPIDCSLCGSHNFRLCGCPWDKPFDRWPRHKLVQVKAQCPPSSEGRAK